MRKNKQKMLMNLTMFIGLLLVIIAALSILANVGPPLLALSLLVMGVSLVLLSPLIILLP
jgi:hypothetical protein